MVRGFDATGRPNLSPSDMKKGTRAAVAWKHFEKRLRKKELAIQERAQLLDLARSAFASPVISGVVAYGIVSVVEKLFEKTQTTAPAGQPTPQQNELRALLKGLSQFLPTNWNPIGGAVTSTEAVSALAGIDFIALKGAIIIYIASGGNLAGLLASGSNLLSTLPGVLKGVGLAAAP